MMVAANQRRKRQRGATVGDKHTWTGKRIKALREEKNLTQQEFADRLHISQSQVARMETGRNKPSHAIAYLLDLLKDGII